MAARTYVVDSGGTSRLVKRLFVVDSGGTSRLIKRAFAIDSGGTARLIYQGDYTTSGSFTSSSATSFGNTRGYDPNNHTGIGAVGSAMSPTELEDGAVIEAIVRQQVTGTGFISTLVIISGFSSDPGADYFASITVNGVTKNYSDFTYSYSSGVGTWKIDPGSTSEAAGNPFSIPASGSVDWTLTDYSG